MSVRIDANGVDWRKRHPDIVCLGQVEGQGLPLDRFQVRDMNFGQQWQAPVGADHECSLWMPKQFIAESLSPWLEEFRADVERHPDARDEMEASLREAGWPSAEDIIGDPRLLLVVVEYFGLDLILLWLDEPQDHQEPVYVLNSVDSLVATPDAVVFRGQCRRFEKAGANLVV